MINYELAFLWNFDVPCKIISKKIFSSYRKEHPNQKDDGYEYQDGDEQWV